MGSSFKLRKPFSCESLKLWNFQVVVWGFASSSGADKYATADGLGHREGQGAVKGENLRKVFLDGSEIRRAPVEVGSLSHYLPVEPHEAVAEVSKIENL